MLEPLWFLLITIFAACGTARAVADDNAPLPGSTAEQSQVDEPQMRVGMVNQAYGLHAARAAPRPDPRQFLLRRLGRRMGQTGARHGHSQPGLVAGADELHGTRIPGQLLFENNVASTTTKNLTDFDALIAWSFNRRLMLEVTGAYQWTDPRTGLRETAASRTGGPSSIDRHRIVVLFLQFQGRRAQSGVGGDPDHVQLRPGRIRGPGLLVRPRAGRAVLQLLVRQFCRAGCGGHQLNDIGYDITLAKTVTDPDTPLLGNLTFFVENYAQTDLDGSHDGRTLVTVTPGVRFNLGKCDGVKMGKDNWLMFGTDIPISDYKPWDAIYRLTYVKLLGCDG